jgi:hypothetical protein
MPILKQFPACRVVIYAGDHLAAHVHIQLRDGRECTVELDSLKIKGSVAPREVRAALLWVQQNRGRLYGEWQRYNP